MAVHPRLCLVTNLDLKFNLINGDFIDYYIDDVTDYSYLRIACISYCARDEQFLNKSCLIKVNVNPSFQWNFTIHHANNTLVSTNAIEQDWVPIQKPMKSVRFTFTNKENRALSLIGDCYIYLQIKLKK